MNKQRMSVQTVAEILTEELSKIEGQTNRFVKATERVEQVTDKLLKSEVKVDSREVKDIYTNMSRQLSDHVMLKQSVYDKLFWLFFSFVLVTIIACFMAGYYYSQNEKNKDNAIYWHEQYQAVKK